MYVYVCVCVCLVVCGVVWCRDMVWCGFVVCVYCVCVCVCLCVSE